MYFFGFPVGLQRFLGYLIHHYERWTFSTSNMNWGTSLVVQWLGLHTLTARATRAPIPSLVATGSETRKKKKNQI